MTGSRRSKPPSAAGTPRAQPARGRPAATSETFSRFVSNLARLEAGRPQAGKGRAEPR